MRINFNQDLVTLDGILNVLITHISNTLANDFGDFGEYQISDTTTVFRHQYLNIRIVINICQNKNDPWLTLQHIDSMQTQTGEFDINDPNFLISIKEFLKNNVNI